MPINQSKKNSARVWANWQQSGAVGNADSNKESYYEWPFLRHRDITPLHTLRAAAWRNDVRVRRVDNQTLILTGKFTVEFTPNYASVKLINDWHGAREGDFALAIYVAMTGRNPLEWEQYQEVAKIRGNRPKSKFLCC